MDYEQFKIKEYELWDLFLYKNQYPYIGRCYASAKNQDADLITSMTPSECCELLYTIIPEWHRSVIELYKCDRPNIAISGNTWNHLHCHLIPRYNSKRSFEGIDFIDPNPKGNYSPYPKKEISLDILHKIKQDISKIINSQNL